MPKESSFDVVSEVNSEEVKNAVQTARKEIANRFDFKNSVSEIKLENNQLILISDDEFKLEQVKDVLANKLIKRNVSTKNIRYQKTEHAFGGNVRQVADLISGIDKEQAKRITQLIKQSEIKAKSQIQGDQIRVSGKSHDDLQKIIALLREANLPIELNFTNYR